MAVGPIQFGVSTNARLKSLGRNEVITSVRSYPTDGYIDYDVCYVTDGKQMAQWVRRCPPDSLEHFTNKFLAHLCDSEYQQYLDDHKAMTLGSLFGENHFPRARERAFLDFRTLAASQQYFSDDRNYAPRDAEIRKVLCTYLTQVSPPGFVDGMIDGSGISDNKALIRLRWHGHSKDIQIPLSQDMPWYTAAQQARDTLRAWIDEAAQKKSDTAMAGNDCTVWIWGIEYPNARVEYHEGIERIRSTFGFTRGAYKAGAKTSGVPRTVEENGPFDIVLKHRNGDIVALHGCSWIVDGEVCCTSITKNGKSSFQPEMGVAAAQKIPAGAMVASDGEVVGKATPARATAYLNGTPVGVLTGIDYSGTVRLTDAKGRVTTTAQQVREAIDRSNAISVPTREEIKRSLLERVANDGSRKVSEVMVGLVAESTHETYKAIAQVAEGLRLQEDACGEFEQSRMRFDNLASQPLTQGNLKKAFAELTKPMAHLQNPLDSAPQIGDNEGMSEPNAEHVREWQQYVHDHKELRAGKLLEISDCAHPRAREWAYAHSDREHPNTVEQYASSNFCEVDWYAGKSLIENYLRLRGVSAKVETDKTRWSDEKLAAARISARGITLDHFIPKRENTWIRLAWEVFTRIAPALGMSLDKTPAIGDDVSVDKPLWPTTHELERMTSQERTAWHATARMRGDAPPKLFEFFKEIEDMNEPVANPSFKNRATAEAIEVAYRTAAIKLPDLVRKQLVKRMASKGGKRPSQARLSLAEEMLSGDEGSLIVAGILSLALSASPEFIKSKMPWLDLDRLARELRLNVETRIACAVADMLGMYFDGALEALKEAFGGSQQLLLAESSKPDESALFNGAPKAESVGVR